MPQIVLNGICKAFKVPQRPEGRLGILRGAFKRETKIIRALEDITFKIGEGELVGYIGPNGAGKSTTVKVMSGILTPDAGTCAIMNRIPWKERVAHAARIGVVFGQRSQLWWDVPVKDSFDLLRDIYNIPEADYRKRLAELAEILDISSLLKTPARQLSLGRRMRCEIAAALLHSPRILFLDEPTIGLDAVSKLALRDFLKNENRRNGVTMILTTHDMDDIETLCDRVMVIGHGRILFDGVFGDLKKQYAPLRCIRAVVDGNREDIQISGAEKVQVEGNIWTVWFNPHRTSAHGMINRIAEKLTLKDIAIEESDIDETIATMYREMGL